MLQEKSANDLEAVCHTASAGRSHFEHRLAVRAASLAEAREALAAVARGETHARIRQGCIGNAPVPGVVFLLTGQGSQYAGMGRELYETEPVFRRELDRCAEILKPLLDRPLLNLLYGADSTRLDQTRYTQPALFAVEYALAALWRSWGVEPAVVLGHSVGEYVAACVAGVFSLEDGLKLIAERGRLMATLPADGAMAAVFADEVRVAAAVGAGNGKVAIACLNAPASVVVSGDRTEVQAVLDRLSSEGVKSKALTVSHAFHSPLMDPILAPFEQVAQTITYSSPQIAIISNTTGQQTDPDLMTNAGYWRRHIRQPVRFEDSIRALRNSGHSIFLEIGPEPVLTGLARQTAGENEITWAASLARGRSDWDAMLAGVATLYVRGVNFNWPAFFREPPPPRVALPTYPFQRSRYWLEPVPPVRQASRPTGKHPFLGERFDSPVVAGTVFNLELGVDRPAFLNDHRIFDRLIMPSPAYIEMALAGAGEVFEMTRSESVPCEISNLAVREPLILPDDGACQIQLILDEPVDRGMAFRVCSRAGFTSSGAGSKVSWRTHATGEVRIGVSSAQTTVKSWNREEVRARCSEERDAGAFYDSLIGLGLEFGGRFRGIVNIWRRDGEALGEIRLPDSLSQETTPVPGFTRQCWIHVFTCSARRCRRTGPQTLIC